MQILEELYYFKFISY